MIDRSDNVRSVENHETESRTLLRQFHVWLALGAAGGAVTIFTLATSADNPDHALRFFQYSLWLFLVSVSAAGSSVFFLSLQKAALAEHIAAAHNRDELNDKIASMPEMLSAPQRLADEHNAPRNDLIAKSETEHDNAESSYKKFERYRCIWKWCLGISAACFILAFAAPMIQISFLNQSLNPPTTQP